MPANNHPGVFLLEELLYRGVGKKEAADGIGISLQLLDDIVWATASITRNTASQIAEYLGTSAILWLNLQKAFDAAKE